MIQSAAFTLLSVPPSAYVTDHTSADCTYEKIVDILHASLYTLSYNSERERED